MAVAQVEITKPIVIWLREPGSRYSAATSDAVIAAVESLIMRRRLLRLTSSDLNRVMSELISRCRGVGDDQLVAAVTQHLANQQVASTYWPGDDEIRSALRAADFYWRCSRPMTRLFLHAIEDAYRGCADAGLGAGGTREALRAHDVLLLNRAVIDAGEGGWDEVAIEARTDALVAMLLRTWPVPAGHEGKIVDRTVRVSKATAKYSFLIDAGLLGVGAELV